MIIATIIVLLTFRGPIRNRTLFSEIHGNITPVNLANATPTAAIDPHCITRKVVQPNKKPRRG
jgi:hypothetical protein